MVRAMGVVFGNAGRRGRKAFAVGRTGRKFPQADRLRHGDAGDEVRIYGKEPGKALRSMNTICADVCDKQGVPGSGRPHGLA